MLGIVRYGVEAWINVVVVTDLPALTCANAVPVGAGYALGTLAVAFRWRFQGSPVPVFELFASAG